MCLPCAAAKSVCGGVSFRRQCTLTYKVSWCKKLVKVVMCLPCAAPEVFVEVYLLMDNLEAIVCGSSKSYGDVLSDCEDYVGSGSDDLEDSVSEEPIFNVFKVGLCICCSN